MPIKLVKIKGSPFYYGRGSYLGVRLYRSTQATRPQIAKGIIKTWEAEIERGRLSTKSGPTFMSAAVSYMQAGGERTYLPKLIAHFGETALADIDQAATDNAAAALYPNASNATRNRQAYTPISAVMRHAGVRFDLRRPKGAQGQKLSGWMPEDAAFGFLDAAYKIDAEFGIYLVVLLYTGCRLSEPLKVTCEDLNITASEMFVGKTKNGEPRRVFLPPIARTALANHPRGLDRPGERLFRFRKDGRLYRLIRQAADAAGFTFPPRQKFHLLRHTFATWMRRHAGADIDVLLSTGAWSSAESVRRYMHAAVDDEARTSALLPAPKSKVG